MAAKNKWSEKVTGIKISIADLELYAQLADSPYFEALQKLSKKMHTLWRDQSFKLDESDPNFILKHQRFVEREIGINMFLRFIFESKKKLDKQMEEDGEIPSKDEVQY